ncbi:MAG: DUF1330 domain-containing protein [Pseudomonadota bacterium]
MSSIHPRPGALGAAREALDPDSPVVMINLLRFREQAEDDSSRTGREAYADYGRHTQPLLASVGGQVMHSGGVAGMLIAPDGESWDDVLIVRYPHYGAFLSMVMSDAYQAIVHHRTAALADSRLIATRGSA